MRLLKYINGLLLLMLTTTLSHAALQTDLQFSTDDGKTYNRSFPVVESGSVLYAKVNYEVVDEPKKIKDGVVTSSLANFGSDFASANVGKQNRDGKSAWYQRCKKYWGGKITGEFIYRIDLGARPEGVMGEKNKWDSSQGKFIDAPLPPLAELAPGEYVFNVLIGYYVEGIKEKKNDNITFYVSILDKSGEVVKGPAPKSKPIVKKEIVPVTMSLPEVQGEYVFAITNGYTTPQQRITKNQIHRLSKGFFAWKVTDVSSGKYYLRLLVESGSRTGEEYLSKPIPFLYLNGKAIHFTRSSKLTSYKNIFVSVIESETPIEIKNGDEIRWNSKRRSYFGALSLAKDKMEVAPIWVRPFFNPELNDYFRIEGGLDAVDAQTAMLKFSVRNITGSTNDLSIQCRVLDYFQNTVDEFTDSVELANYESKETEVKVSIGDSDRYRAIVTITDGSGESYEKVFELLADQFDSVRKKIWLNNDWQWTSIADDKTLKTRTLQNPSSIKDVTKWNKTSLPANWKDKTSLKGDHLAWYKKSFSVSPNFKNGRYFINISRISHEGNIYLNGKLIGSASNPNELLKFEITDELKFDGLNTMLIAVRDKTAELEPSELTKSHMELSTAGALRAPINMRTGLGEVYLTSTPITIVDDVFVKTSFQNKSIGLEITLPQDAVNKNYSLYNKILLDGKTLFEFKTIVADKSNIQLSEAWDNPPLWGPTEFPLLTLETELKDANGNSIDTLKTRFGFREFWAEGKSLKWNGEVVKFGSRPFFSTWSWGITTRDRRDLIRKSIRKAKRLDCNMLRHIYNSDDFASIADEEGMVIVQGGAHTVSGHTKQQVDSDLFWQNTSKYAKAQVRGLRNYPSIVEWYLSNEYYGFSEPKNKARLVTVGEDVLKVDNTRLIEFGCDLDLAGYNNLISVHYPVDVESFRMDDTFLPEAAYWRYFKDDFKPGMKVPAGMCKRVANVHGESQLTWGYKPIIINETCWISFFKMPDGLSRIFSDHVYESPWAVDYAHDLANTWFSHGHRDADVSAVTLWKHLGDNPNWISLPKIDIDVLQKYNKFYSGQKIVYDVNLIRDLYNQADVIFSWELRDEDGKVLSGTENLMFKSCELKRLKLPLKMPKVDKQKEYSMVLTLKTAKQKKILREVDFPIIVYPKKQTLQSNINIGVFDATEKSLQKISDILGSISNVKTLSQEVLSKLDLLIIGENQPVELLEQSSDELTEFVENGGKVLLLQQDKEQPWLPIKLIPSRRVSAINYTFRPEHQLLKNVTEDELSFWFPNHKVGANYYMKPDTGNFRVIVESGGPNGMVYAGVVELLKGKGAFICSQLYILDNSDENPVCQKLWKNIISYAGKKEMAKSTAGYLGEGSKKFIIALKKSGVQYNELESTSEMSKYKVVIFEPTSEMSESDINNVKSFVKDGGTLLIHKTTPSTVNVVSNICDMSIQLLPIRATSWQGRAVRLAYKPIVEGLTSFDFFWRERPENENYRPTYFSSSQVQETLGEWQMVCENGEELCYPNLITKLDIGKGTIVLDNLNWETDNKKVIGKARRIGCTLLTNLGVEVRGFKALEIPENLSYTAVDVSEFLNRSFIDDKDGDGLGGWTDQGADSDLRTFPVEQAIFESDGVPFKIEQPQSCLVLKSKYRPVPSQSVTLPINLSADVLFFLQSSAWTSAEHHASYIINYTDGTKYEIKLVGGVNLRDWAARSAADPFLYELDTITKVAWTGDCEKYGQASLYMLAWLNPYSKKNIESVTFVSMNKGIPVLVGITAGNKTKKLARSKSTPESFKKSELLNVEGEQLLKDKKILEAENKFKKAIETAWDNPTSYLSLGYLYEQQDQLNKAIVVYEKLLKAVPDELEAYMRIGKCQEVQGNLEAALETYRRSLDADINQPDVMQTLDDVKKKIKE
jgi:beta-galactosidase